MPHQQVAMVTGAAGGIGRGVALALAGAGYDLFLHTARDPDAAARLCACIEKDCGRRAFFTQEDLADPDAPDRIFREFDRRYDRLDLFVNNAGITAGAPFLQTTRDTVDLVCDVNFKGAYFCVQHAAKRMVAGKIPGSITIITSNQQEYIMARSSVYGSVKSALLRFSKHVSMELAGYGIRVNAIAPGYVDSSPRMAPHREKSMPYIPLKRWATVEEVGQAVLYLASPAAGFITGSCLVMDGGAVNQHFPMETFAQGEGFAKEEPR